MWYRLEQITNEISRSVDRMDRDQWMVVSIVAVAVGAMFLRGFGSRTGY